MRRPAVLVALLLLSTCSQPTRPLDASALQARKAHTIGVVAAPRTPTFRVVHNPGAGDVVGSLVLSPLLVMLIESSGDGAIIGGVPLVDPAADLARRLAGAVAAKHGLVAQTPKALSVTQERVEWDTDLILQVTTKQWGIADSTTDHAHYRAYYVAALELRDARDGQVVVAGECTMPLFFESKGDPTAEEMAAAHGALMRRAVVYESDLCGQELARRFLGIRLPGDKTPESRCHLEGTPAWEAADPLEKRRMLHECQDRLAREAKAAADAGAPVAPASVDGGAP